VCSLMVRCFLGLALVWVVGVCSLRGCRLVWVLAFGCCVLLEQCSRLPGVYSFLVIYKRLHSSKKNKYKKGLKR
jgi:hypothetical protein